MIKAENGMVRFEGRKAEVYVDMLEILRVMNCFLDDNKDVKKLASTDADFLEPLVNLFKKVL